MLVSLILVVVFLSMFSPRSRSAVWSSRTSQADVSHADVLEQLMQTIRRRNERFAKKESQREQSALEALRTKHRPNDAKPSLSPRFKSRCNVSQGEKPSAKKTLAKTTLAQKSFGSLGRTCLQHESDPLCARPEFSARALNFDKRYLSALDDVGTGLYAGKSGYTSCINPKPNLSGWLAK